ncbi:MAG: DUF3419 family protein [Hyphomicrobiaceae bacterium]
MTSHARHPPDLKNSRLIEHAVRRHPTLSRAGLLERVFALAFSRLVYAQIWEDPVVDMEALEISPQCRMVTIASGGCKVLSYLTANPARIDAVDLNAAHIALNRLKLTAAASLPGHAAFARLFAASNDPANITAYERYIRPALDDASRRYWDGRDGWGRRRITRFSRDFYHYGLLGRFIGLGHWIAWIKGRDPARLLAPGDAETRQRIFDHEFAPLFERGLLRRVLNHPAALFGLGIPPAQFTALAGAGGTGMADVVKERLARLACAFDPRDNYFAWQAFARTYAPAGNGPLPPYLAPENFESVRAGTPRVAVHHASMTGFLATHPAASFDRYVLLDAQDWMDNAALDALWHQITRTSRPGARVIFRTAAVDSLLPGRLDPSLLSRWRYDEARSRSLHARDRSAIYGGFHLYVREETAT